MATQNSINSNIPIEIAKGGTENTSFTSNAPLYYDGTKLTSVSGAATTVLTSQGVAMPPIFVNLPTFFALLSSDPGSPSAGDTWYNTTTNLFKGAVFMSNTWAIKSPMNTALQMLAGAGSSGADVLSFGGTTGSGGTAATTQRYDGTLDSWTNKANMNQARTQLAGCGTASSALSIAGYTTMVLTTTELYDGIGNTWTNEANLNNAVRANAAAGSISDALSFGGLDALVVPTFRTERYNGTSWANKANLPLNRYFLAGSSTAATALAYGGSNNSIDRVETDLYSGIGDTWTAVANLNVARNALAGSGLNSSAALSFGGLLAASGNSPVGTTEIYNGTWTVISPLNISRGNLGGAGTTTDALAFGGTTGVPLATNERLQSGITIVTFTLS